MANTGSDLSFMNGVPELLILRLLSRREMYGYEIVRSIGESTGQMIVVGEGCVYPLLHAMERKKWVTTRKMAAEGGSAGGGRMRIYYRLTNAGHGQLEKAAGRWTELSNAVNAVLGAGHVADARG
jgi:PadR family transcriptional regulator PadR